MITQKPLAITARQRINATYSIQHGEVTIRRILEEIDKLLEEYRAENKADTNDCPLIAIADQLRILKDNPTYGSVFGQLNNSDTPVPYSVLEPIIAALPLKMHNPRYCARYHVLVAGVHAAMIDMLSVDEIVQRPVVCIPSYTYIWSSDEVEKLDDIFFRIARYVGISASTSGLARRMYLNQLNTIRKRSEWGDVITKLITVLASRITITQDFDAIQWFFSNLSAWANAKKELVVLEALVNLDHYYNGSNCHIFKEALEEYCHFFAIPDEERVCQGFMLNEF